MKPTLQLLKPMFSVCRLPEGAQIPKGEFCFTGRTDEEFSLVCPTSLAPAATLDREDGWRALRFVGTFDFSLIGILAPVAELFARERIPIFVISTYNTDYVLTKEMERAIGVLRDAGYEIVE